MFHRRQMLGLFAGGAALSLAGCGLLEKKPKEYRFRLTVEVDTPEGVRRGHSVWAVLPYATNSIVGPQAALDFRGEAVAVDLPGGQTLYALLTGATGESDYAKQLPGRALGSRLVGEPQGKDGPTRWRNSAELYPEAPKTIGLLNTHSLPLLVHFRDPRDPMSVEAVDPDNLAASFGPGVVLKRITIEVTDEDVTTGIEERLGSGFWKNWGRIHNDEMHRDGGVMKNPYFQSLAGRLSRNDFIAGTSK